MWLAQAGTRTARAWVVLFFFFSPFPQSHEELGRGREVRTHTHPSTPDYTPPSSSTCLLLPGSWKNVKLSSVIKVGFSKGFKNISESKTLFFLQKTNLSIVPLTDASRDLVFPAGFPLWVSTAWAGFLCSFEHVFMGACTPPRCKRACTKAQPCPRMRKAL